MRKRVVGFFVVFLVFSIALAVITNMSTGSISNISGYSIAVEDESYDGSVYGGFLAAFLMVIIFVYVSRFIFDFYNRRTQEYSFKRAIDIDLRD
jgi:hypothetical protein